MKVSAFLFVALAGVSGAAVQHALDHAAIVHAQQNEMQANGLEDECRSTLAQQVETVLDEDKDTGDYQLSVYGGRPLVCEEKDVTVIRQPDALKPIVIECKH